MQTSQEDLSLPDNAETDSLPADFSCPRLAAAKGIPVLSWKTKLSQGTRLETRCIAFLTPAMKSILCITKEQSGMALSNKTHGAGANHTQGTIT